MSGDSNVYNLKREFFGQKINFKNKEEIDLKFLCFKQDYSAAKNFEQRNPKSITLGNIVEKSSHMIHTEKTKTISVLMKHTEGGWPDSVKDPSETREVQVWKRKTEKEDLNFAQKVKILIANSNSIINQNLRMDIYEEYFDESQQQVNEDNFYAKIKTVFKDNEKYKRTVSKVVLSPDEEQSRIAVAYRLHKNQVLEPNHKLPCLVWDINNPNSPVNTLTCNSEITTVAFNSKHFNMLGAGCSNGTAVIFDLNTSKIIASTKLDESHSETICDFVWLKSKTGTEFVTTSTDGKVLWWDIKNLFAHTVIPSNNATKEALPLPTIEPEKPLMLMDENGEKEYGGMKIEYNPEAGSTKFLIGAEQGTIFQANKKKNEADIQFRFGFKWGRHLGPVTGMQRCPVSTKFFLTVGDWTARIWTEDFTRGPVMISKYHPAYLTDCLWSTRCGLYFISRTDGWINAYDLCYKINESTFTYKVCDSALTSICLNNKGDKLIIGDDEGKIHLLKLSKSFYSQHEIESKKEYINKLFERELAREKYIESLGKKKVQVKDDTSKLTKQEQMIKERVRKIDEEYGNFLTNMLNKTNMPIAREEKKEEGRFEEKKMTSRKENPQVEKAKEDSFRNEQEDKINTSKLSEKNSQGKQDASLIKDEGPVNVNDSRVLDNSKLNMSREKSEKKKDESIDNYQNDRYEQNEEQNNEEHYEEHNEEHNEERNEERNEEHNEHNQEHNQEQNEKSLIKDEQLNNKSLEEKHVVEDNNEEIAHDQGQGEGEKDEAEL